MARPHPRWVHPRGSMTGALMFAVLVTALLAVAALASMQVSRSRVTVAHASSALLVVGDRLQVVVDEVNTVTTVDPVERVGTEERCDTAGVCTTVLVESVSRSRLWVQVTATIPDGATATRSVHLVQLPTSGRVVDVDELGRPVYATDGGSGTGRWRLGPEVAE